ncbi:MAG: acyl-CoA thioesterase [Acidobacteria bacterium]|nr:acyl-CoA thioesterase [Acidobacteriota bacterium]
MAKEKLQPPRLVRESQAEIAQVVLPNDANPLGNILGGTVMHMVDMLAAIAAQRHCGSYVVTASVDHVDFRYPIRVGEIIVLKASVNRAFHRSMEVGVKVFREDNFTHQRKHTSSAYLTFVAIDENRKPRPVPPVVPETREEKRRYQEAGKRRQWRLQHLTNRRHPS